MSRVRTTKRKKAEKNKEWPAVVYFWIFGMIILGYVIGRIALDAYPHPYHWLSGLIGGILGLGLGWVWYWKKGDVF